MTTILAPEDSAKRIGASKPSHSVEMWGCGDGGANSTTMRIAGRDEELRRLRAKLAHKLSPVLVRVFRPCTTGPPRGIFHSMAETAKIYFPHNKPTATLGLRIEQSS